MDRDILVNSGDQFEDTGAGKSHKKSYLLPTLAACLVLVMMIVALSFLQIPVAQTDEPTYSPGESNAPDGLMDIFLADDDIYYTTTQGQLFLQTETGSELVREFPVKNLFWSQAKKAFLYYHMGAIYSWDPETDTASVLADGLPQPEDGQTGYFIAQVGEDYFFRVFNRAYRYHLPTKELFTEEREITNTVAYDGRYYLYDTDQTIVCIDGQTGQRRALLTLEPSQTITCACIDGDTLFYVSDFKLQSIALTEGADDGTDRFLPVREYKYIQAITCNGEDMVFLTEYHALSENGSSGRRLTKVMLCTRDGNIVTLREPAEPAFIIPGSCKLVATKKNYCYGVRSDPSVVIGDLSNYCD